MSTGPAGEPKHRIPPYTKREPSARRVRVWPLRIGGAGTSLLSQRMAEAFTFGCFCGLMRNIISLAPFFPLGLLDYSWIFNPFQEHYLDGPPAMGRGRRVMVGRLAGRLATALGGAPEGLHEFRFVMT